MSSLDEIRRAAWELLARRDYTRHEFTQKLIIHYSMHDIEAIAEEFIQAGYLNDLRFLVHFIEKRKAKGYGPLRIIAELEARGLTAEMIAEELKITDNAWTIAAQKTWQKRFKSLPCDFKTRAKQIRFLQHRGFTAEQIKFLLTTEHLPRSQLKGRASTSPLKKPYC